jgi:hypothetical protein
MSGQANDRADSCTAGATCEWTAGPWTVLTVSRYLDTVFELAKVKDAHSHRFLDTFGVSLLEKECRLKTCRCSSDTRPFGFMTRRYLEPI